MGLGRTSYGARCRDGWSSISTNRIIAGRKPDPGGGNPHAASGASRPRYFQA